MCVGAHECVEESGKRVREIRILGNSIKLEFRMNSLNFSHSRDRIDTVFEKKRKKKLSKALILHINY